MMKHRLHIIYILSAIVSLASCSDQIAMIGSSYAPVGEPVNVHINLGVASMDNGGGTETSKGEVETRAALGRTDVDDPDDNIKSTQIKTLWVLQYGPNTDTSTDDTGSSTDNTDPEGNWRLQSNGAQIIDLENHKISDYGSSGSQTIQLAGSGENENIVVFLANVPETWLTNESTNSAFSGGARLSELRNHLYRPMTKRSDTDFLYSPKDDNSSSTDETLYLPLAGEWKGKIGTTGSVLGATDDNPNPEILLHHSEARLDITVTNNTTSDTDRPVTIDRVRLCNIPAGHFFYPIYNNDYTNFPTTLISMGTIDYDPVTVNLAPKANSGDKASKWSYTWYMPANQRGTVNSNNKSLEDDGRKDNSTENLKNLFAPSYATYLLVEGHYKKTVDGTNQEVPITYTFYLGANMTNDFNIKVNNKYTYNININDQGDAGYDFRIEDWGDVDITDIANCYVLNPVKDPYTFERGYTVPISRINTYWQNYADQPDKALKVGDKWTAEILWTDFDNSDDKVRLSTSSGEVIDANVVGRFGVKVKKGARGNVLVGVKKEGDSDYLWSWHLWVTDYQPDDALYKVAAADIYNYPVDGGNVQRYADASTVRGNGFWKDGGLYETKFIMDRNLGAWNRGSSTGGALFYQYGRKDPFPGDGYYANGSATIINSTYSAREASAATSMSESVKHPTTYYYLDNGSMWLDDAGSINPNYLWGDSRATPDNHRKSIFDPCPPGYKIPERDMGDTGDSKNRTIWSAFPRDAAESGAVYYWPTSETPSNSLYQVVYPYVGRLTSGGSRNTDGNHFYIYESNNYLDDDDKPQFYVLHGRYTSDDDRNVTENVITSALSSGYSVRCITE